MVEKISNLEQISQFLQDGNICSDRVKLYLELAKVSPGRLVLLKNSKQYVTLYKELGRKAASPSLLIEHYFFYQANNKDFKKIIPTSEVQDILDFIYHHYDDFWLSYDNLLPNQHDCDDEIHRYNLLQLQGLTYESYLSQLNSNSRFNLKKALNRTADAETIHITGYDQLSHYIKTFIKDHYYLKYGEESLLRNDLILSETLIAAKLFNTHLYVIQAESRYAFILFAKIDGSLYVLFIGGSDAFMIKRAYHLLIKEAIENWLDITHVDAGSDYPFLKRQMGFQQSSYFALIKGERDWKKLIF